MWEMRYTDTAHPRLMAHRGGARAAPENTLAAFLAGVEAGADILELDVHASRDGHIVVIHDETVDRTTDASGRVSSFSLTELGRLDAGFRFRDEQGRYPFRGRGIRIPTLEELLAACPQAALNIEIKQAHPPIEARVIELLAHHCSLDRTLLTAGDDTIMARIRALDPPMLTGFATAEVAEFVMRVANDVLHGYSPPGFALQVPVDANGVTIVSDELLTAAHHLDVEVHVWTINDPAAMVELVARGVDGIISDDVAAALAVLRGHEKISKK